MNYPYDDIENDELATDMAGEKAVNQESQDQDNDQKALLKYATDPNITPSEPVQQSASPTVQPAAALPSIAPLGSIAQPSATPSSNIADMMNQYQQLQQQRQKDTRNLAIIDALSGVGQSLAARNVPDYKVQSNMDMYQKLANQPVQDYTDKVKQQALDAQLKEYMDKHQAGTPVAKALTQVANAQGYNIPEGLSESDFDKLKLENPNNAKYQAAHAKQAEQVADLVNQKMDTGKISLNDAKLMRDPDSQISEFARISAVKKGYKPEDIEGMSAWDLHDLVKEKTGVAKAFQSKTGSYTDENGNKIRTSGIFDPNTGQYKDTDGKVLKGFIAEGVNPFQLTKNQEGQDVVFSKSQGIAPTTLKPSGNFNSTQTPQDVYSQLTPVDRKELNEKIIPNFNKLTEKTQQRLMHEAPIMAKLNEAQINPAAYAQLQAELARFDVGDQRLAQQEFNMFATRHGYKGWGDWVQKNSTGTISPDFANDFAHTITNTVKGMKQDLNNQAENQANLIINRLPPGQKADPKLIAPLIYAGYQPVQQSSDMVQVTSKATGKTLMMPKDKTDQAKKQGLID